MRYLKLTLVTVFFLLFVAGGNLATIKKDNENIVQIKEETVIIKEELELNKDNLLSKVKEIGFRFPKIVMAQFILESGHLTSSLTKSNNNISGMKFPRVRNTTATAELNGYAYFDTWEDCVEDRFIYENLYLADLNREEYLSFLGNTYAEDPNYISKILSIEKSIKD